MHDGMSLERQHGVAQDRAASCPDSAGWVIDTRSFILFIGYFGQTRLPHAAIGECGTGLVVRAQPACKAGRHCLATSAPSLCTPKIRHLVLENAFEWFKPSRSSHPVG